MPRKIQWYGWRKQLPDARDYRYSPDEELLASAPSSVDLRPNCPEIYDQGQIGSCTANAIAGVLEFDQKKQGVQEFTPSRLMIYYNERLIEGTVNSDSGAELRDGIKSVATQGACPESEWPYDVSKFTEKPPDKCYTDATQYEALTYEAVQQNADHLKVALASGFPVAFGFTCYPALESSDVAKTGVLPMPSPDEAPIGGHAVCIVGYDDAQSTFMIRNSWGQGWGLDGYFTMPYQYALDPNLASDFWVISLTGSPSPSPQPSPTPTPTPTPYYPNLPRVSLSALQHSAFNEECVGTKSGKEVGHWMPKPQ